MLALELITEDIPPLRPSDTAIMAIGWMDEFKVAHLPLVKNNKFLGLLSESDILDIATEDEPIEQLDIPVLKVGSRAHQHMFEVVKLIADHQLTTVPVIDNEENFLGSISIKHLMEVISDMSIISDPGGIIILELNIRDYSMSEISRIIEGNDAKILGSFVTSHPDSTKMEVTLKVNKSNLDAILQTFDRFDYTVTASFGTLAHREDLKDRFDSFMNYLNL